MPTRLDKPLKREVEVDGALYTVTVGPAGIRVVPKGRRKGHDLTWQAIIRGDATLAEDLRISLDAVDEGR